MIARGFFFSVWPPASEARVGRPKERVLPEPVRPRPRMSLPARASGMVAAWIGKGAVTPFWASLRTMPSGRPRSPKVIVGSASASASSKSSAEPSRDSSDSSDPSAATSASRASMISSASAASMASVTTRASASMISLESFSGMTERSELEMDMRNAKPSGVSARAQTP